MMRGHEPQEMGEVPRLLSDIVDRRPGIHFRELKRAADLSSNGQLRHHLDRLKRQGVLVEIKDGGFKRFFIAGEHDPEVRRGLARFARRVPRLIAKLLLRQSLNRTQLRQRLDCADSTLGYHLNRMIELGDLERDRRGNCCLYSLTDREFVQRVLQDLGEDVPGKPRPSRSRDASSKIVEKFYETFGPGWSVQPSIVLSATWKLTPDPQPQRAQWGTVSAGNGAKDGGKNDRTPRGDLEVVEWLQPG